MNWAELDKEFAEYEKEIPCVICRKPAKPTVAGSNFKCWGCGHIFKEDGSKIEVECHCKKCMPEHDPLKGKTKGKRAELQLPEKKVKKSKKMLRRLVRKNKRSES